MEKPIDKKDIRISTFSNGSRWTTPVIDIACASFLFSAIAPNMAGVQFDHECQDVEQHEDDKNPSEKTNDAR